MNRICHVILALLLLISLGSLVYGARISGEIYDLNFNSLNNAVVRVNTEPVQQKIAENGNYEFEVALGTYTVSAKYYRAQKLVFETEEEIVVSSDGKFTLDLILFPYLAEDDELYKYLNETFDVVPPPKIPSTEFQLSKIVFVLLLVMFVIVLIIILLFLIFERPKKEKKNDGNKLLNRYESETDSIQDTEEYYQKIVDFIKKERRVTQKQIRKIVPLSESKVSLILTELEHKGIIKKIKKGRGNIILFSSP